MVPIQLPHRTPNFVQRFVDLGLAQTSESRRHAAGPGGPAHPIVERRL
jgi:hypothetical protein